MKLSDYRFDPLRQRAHEWFHRGEQDNSSIKMPPALLPAPDRTQNLQHLENLEKSLALGCCPVCSIFFPPWCKWENLNWWLYTFSKQDIPNQFFEYDSNPIAHVSRPSAALNSSFMIIYKQLHIIIGIWILKQLSIHVVISSCTSWWNDLHIFPKYIPQSLENLNLVQTAFSCINIFSSPHDELFSLIYLRLKELTFARLPWVQLWTAIVVFAASFPDTKIWYTIGSLHTKHEILDKGHL